MLFARTIAAAVPSIAIAVTSAAIAPSATMLFAFALGPWSLAFGGKLMELGSLAARYGRLLRLALLLLRLLRLALLLLSALTPVGTRPAIGPPILALSLAVALLPVAASLL